MGVCMSGINRDAYYFRVEGSCWGADIFDSFLEMAGNSLNKLSRLFFSIFGECGNNIKADCNNLVPFNASHVVIQLRNDSKGQGKTSEGQGETSVRRQQILDIPASPKNAVEDKSTKLPNKERNHSGIGKLNPEIPVRSSLRISYSSRQNQKPQPSADQLKNDITKLKKKLTAVKLKFRYAIQSYQADFKKFKSKEIYGNYKIDHLSKKIDDLNEKIIRKELVLQKVYPNDFEKYQKKLLKEFDEEIFHMELG